MMNFGEKVNLAVKPVSLPSSRSGDGVSDQFPAGLRVLVVDDDPTCLRILEKMLINCLYEVTKCNRAEIALKLLRDNKNGYDIVISDVHMPDMDGFKLLEHVGLEMDLPVIMMSADDSKNVVMKGVTHGACDYLIKPVSMEALKNIWQHVIRKRKHEWREKELGSVESAENQEKLSENVDHSSSANEGKSSKKRKDEKDEYEDRDDTSTLKKPRVVWSVELHQQFVTAVNQLGIDKAVPKRILELMNVPGLTRENVASHLQKYRLYLRRLSCVSPHGNSFVGPPDMSFGLTGIDRQALAASGQIPPQSLASVHPSVIGRVDQRNIFSFENLKHQENNNNKHVNLLYGNPTNMDSKQLAIFGSMNIPPNGVLGRSRSENFHGKAQPVIEFARIQNADLPGNNSFPLVNNSGKSTLTPQFQEVNSGMTRGFVPNYDGFNELNNPNRACDWGSSSSLRTNVERSVLVQPVFPSSEKIGESGISALSANLLRIKTESLHEMGFQNSHYSEHFGQEDLMTALLKQQQEGVGPVENEFGFDGCHFDNLPV